MDRLTQSRVAVDLGAPVLEQLVLAHLIADADVLTARHRERLRDQRDRLAAAVTDRLPEWRFRLPSGGLALWCELPGDHAVALATEAERRDVIVAPGPVFAAAGGLNRFVRLPWTRPADELEEAVDRLGEAWAVVRASDDRASRRTSRVMVA